MKQYESGIIRRCHVSSAIFLYKDWTEEKVFRILFYKGLELELQVLYI